MIDWEGIALVVLAAFVASIMIWEYIEWRIHALIGWFMRITQRCLELAVEVAQTSHEHIDELDERVKTLVDEIVRARVDEAMRRFYNGEVLVEPPADAAHAENTPISARSATSER